MFETVLNIDGMMCPMCTSHVNDAIRQAFPVKKVKATLKNNGETTIISENEIEKDKLEKVIGELGYKVPGYTVHPYEKKKIFGIF